VPLQHAHPMASKIPNFSSNDISKYQEMTRLVNTLVPWHIIQTPKKEKKKKKRNAKDVQKKSSDTVKHDGTSLKYTLKVRYYQQIENKTGVVLGISATISLCSIR